MQKQGVIKLPSYNETWGAAPTAPNPAAPQAQAPLFPQQQQPISGSGDFDGFMNAMKQEHGGDIERGFTPQSKERAKQILDAMSKSGITFSGGVPLPPNQRYNIQVTSEVPRILPLKDRKRAMVFFNVRVVAGNDNVGTEFEQPVFGQKWQDACLNSAGKTFTIETITNKSGNVQSNLIGEA